MGTRRLAAVLGTALLASVLLATGLLGGCANAVPSSGTSPGATVSASPSDQPSPSVSVSPPFSLPPSAPGKPSGSQLEQTITGQVEAGAEHGCLILRDTTGTYQLLGGDPTIVYAGADVSLTGHVVTGVMTYCMQGKPFQITQARRS
jgi:hypothetical protein